MSRDKVDFPAKQYRLLSGSALKLIAVATMLIDHTAHLFLTKYQTVLYTFLGTKVTVYGLLRDIGRISFPIYCFLLVEGFAHTKHRERYGLELLLFALISEIPWNLEHSGMLFYLGTGSGVGQNVGFTLFFGFLAMYVLERFAGRRRVLPMLGILLAVLLANADYGFGGLGMLVMLYVLREDLLLKAVLGSCILSSRWVAGLAFIPISLYNGKRGFIRGKAGKYLFYAIYPVHLFLFYLIKKNTVGY